MSLSKFGHHITINVKNTNKFTATGDIDVKNFKIINVKLPEHGSDAANKEFVDNYLKDFYNGVSDSLQSIIKSTDNEYNSLKKSIENLKNQINLSNKNIKAVDTNFKWLKQQTVKLEKDLKSNVIKIQNLEKVNDNIKNLKQQLVKLEKDVTQVQIDNKNLVNKSNANIKNDLSNLKKEQDEKFLKKEKELNDTFDKTQKSILDSLKRVESLEKVNENQQKLILNIKTELNQQIIDVSFDKGYFKDNIQKLNLKFNDLHNGFKYFETQSINNNTSIFKKFNDIEKRIENLEKSIP